MRAFPARAGVLSFAALLTLGGGTAEALRYRSAAIPCPIFPRDNSWHQRVDKLPVAHNLALIIRSIGRNIGLHPNFGSGTWAGRPIGIPFNVM